MPNGLRFVGSQIRIPNPEHAGEVVSYPVSRFVFGFFYELVKTVQVYLVPAVQPIYIETAPAHAIDVFLRIRAVEWLGRQ